MSIYMHVVAGGGRLCPLGKGSGAQAREGAQSSQRAWVDL